MTDRVQIGFGVLRDVERLDVSRTVEGQRMPIGQRQWRPVVQRRQASGNAVGLDGLGHFTHQAHHHRIVGAVAYPSRGQRPVQPHHQP